jgi:radical SAM protein with 4Fe4S-binding SPASM domain
MGLSEKNNQGQEKVPYLKPQYFLINGNKNSAIYDDLTNQVIRINHSAAKILELCDGQNLEAIIAETTKMFKIDKCRAKVDILEFLNNSGKDFVDWHYGTCYRTKDAYSVLLQTEEQAEANVTWEITNECNLNCLHCLLEAGVKRGNELTDIQCQKLLSTLPEAGIKEITFSGGEPTLRKNFFQLLKEAKDYGMKTHVFTNGCIKKEIAIKIAKEATGVQTTLLGAIEATHDKLTTKKGSWKKTQSSLEIFSKANLETLTISYVVMKDNITEIKAVEKIAIEYKSRISLGLALPLGRAKANSNIVFLSPSDMALLRNTLTEDQATKNETIHTHAASNNKPRLGKCPCSANSFSITFTGDIIMCPGLRDFVISKIDNQHINKFLINWKKKISDFYEILSVDHIPICSSCELRYSCMGGCRAASYAYLGEIAKNPFCEIYK